MGATTPVPGTNSVEVTTSSELPSEAEAASHTTDSSHGSDTNHRDRSEPYDSESRGAVVTDSPVDRNTDFEPVSDGFPELVEQLKTRYTQRQIEDVTHAYEIARDAHSGQMRSSGEPYITHPIAVSGIIFTMGLDHHSVIAALLHDVIEDTSLSREDLVASFGNEVSHIVDGVSKLNHLKFQSKKEAQAESFRKMLLAMVTDIRVIMIKLADRLHNMRTIGSLRLDKRRRIGKETLEIYAPIATRLGMYRVKSELEDLGFKACYPMRSRILQATVEQSNYNHDQVMKKVTDRITEALSEKGINCTVSSREKHLYSLYNKMRKKQLTFQRVFDMLALRIVVDNTEQCYQVLGVVHQLYPPIFSRFKDYIAVPKQNGYQSIHTVLNYGNDGIPLEVQIRTHAMDAMAESGIAAHWAYKNEAETPIEHRTPGWITKLADIQQGDIDTLEFVENVKLDLFPGEIYVFTPKGKIIQLPRNATPVDFAYAVHSEVGNRCVAAKVDRRLSSLSTPLESGQTVEIITGSDVSPSPMWLNSVVTAKARTSIRQHLRALDRHQAIDFGQRLLRRALSRHERLISEFDDKVLPTLLAERRYPTLEDLYADIGLGVQLPSQIAERLIAIEKGEDTGEEAMPLREAAPVQIDSAANPTLFMSKCCHPIPGDNVQGFFTKGKGVAVHRAGCRNVRRYRRRPKEWVAVEWSPVTSGSFDVVILCHLVHQPGALARVTSTMSLMNVNIENMDFNSRSEDDIRIRFVLSVDNRVQLARIVRRLRNLSVVRSVKRES